MHTPQKISIIIPANLRFSNSVRNFMSDLLHVLNITDVWVNRLILVVDEIFMNAVKYGSKDMSQNVYVEVNFTETEVSFCVEDSGTGEKATDPETLKAMVAQNEEDGSLAKTSGRGLAMIVNNWSDSCVIDKSEHGGIKVFISKKLEGIINKTEEVRQVSMKDMPDVCIIKIEKNFNAHDSASEQNIMKNIQTSDKKLYIIDLQELDYINSVFIGMLAKIYNTIQKRQGKACIISVSKNIQDTLKLVGLIDIMPIVATLAEAKDILLS